MAQHFQRMLSTDILTSKHIDVCTVRDGEDMRWHFATSFASIKFRASMSVYGKSFVGVDGYAEETGVGLKMTMGALSRWNFLHGGIRIVQRCICDDFVDDSLTIFTWIDWLYSQRKMNYQFFTFTSMYISYPRIYVHMCDLQSKTVLCFLTNKHHTLTSFILVFCFSSL